MKPELKMNDDKNSIAEPSVVYAQVAAASEPRKINTKKFLIIGGSVILIVAVVIMAILVGMHIFTQGQKELLKYTMNADKGVKEDVTVDQNENVIEYHLLTDGYEAWIFDDFNRDIQTMKVKTGSGTNCYIGPLNRTSLADPAKISALPNLPSDANKNNTNRLSFDISGTPVTDTSFLGKKAQNACKGTSVYWLHPKCDDKNGPQRNKRCWYVEVWHSYYCYFPYPYLYICTDYYYAWMC